jgi:hypothetical protein
MALALKEAMPLHGIDRMAPSHQEAEGSDRSGDGFFHFLLGWPAGLIGGNSLIAACDENDFLALHRQSPG